LNLSPPVFSENLDYRPPAARPAGAFFVGAPQSERLDRGIKTVVPAKAGTHAE
jgi:hypothetical protein